MLRRMFSSYNRELKEDSWMMSVVDVMECRINTYFIYVFQHDEIFSELL